MSLWVVGAFIHVALLQSLHIGGFYLVFLAMFTPLLFFFCTESPLFSFIFFLITLFDFKSRYLLRFVFVFPIFYSLLH